MGDVENLDVGGGGEEVDPLIAEAPELVTATTTYVLEIKGKAYGSNPPVRRLSFKFDPDSSGILHW